LGARLRRLVLQNLDLPVLFAVVMLGWWDHLVLADCLDPVIQSLAPPETQKGARDLSACLARKAALLVWQGFLAGFDSDLTVVLHQVHQCRVEDRSHQSLKARPTTDWD
jgi:hypothetical protein